MRLVVLDEGYVELIECWGKGTGGRVGPTRTAEDYEAGIVEAARQSTQGSFRGWREDSGLLRTLFEHQYNQSTPFEAAGMTLEIQAPIFVFREWHRHRTQSYNEASGRYIKLPELHYTPDSFNVKSRAEAAQETRHKQAKSIATWQPEKLATWYKMMEQLDEMSSAFYDFGLSIGIPKELARIRMPVGHYSRMRATANLRNWLGFLTLRLDTKAQWEIRQYAEAVAKICREQFPHTMELFDHARPKATA